MEEVCKVFSSTQEKVISKLYAFDPNSSQFSDDWSRNNGGGGERVPLLVEITWKKEELTSLM